MKRIWKYLNAKLLKVFVAIVFGSLLLALGNCSTKEAPKDATLNDTCRTTVCDSLPKDTMKVVEDTL